MMNQNIPLSFSQKIVQYIPGWSQIQQNQITLQRMTGITNQTFHVYHNEKSVQPTDIILRIFGKAVEDLFIDREEETRIYQYLGQAQLGPQIYGFDGITRAEQYIHSRVLQQSQMGMKEYYRKIALYLAIFHQQKIKDIKPMPLPIKVFEEGKIIKAVKEKIQNTIWDAQEKKMIEEIMSLVSENEIKFIQNNLPKNEKSVVFSHNDLLANNVLICEPGKEIKFIDFEYSGYNFRTYDIGNYFAESQFDYNVTEPPYFSVDEKELDEDKIEDFIRYYALATLFPNNKFDQNKLIEDDEYFYEVLGDKEEELDKIVEEMKVELPICLMFSNYYWTLWAIYQAKNPDIKFDYITFAYKKYRKYVDLKEEYFCLE